MKDRYYTDEERRVFETMHPGDWVKYRLQRIFQDVTLVGVGRIAHYWVYDGLIMEIDSPTHGRVSWHIDLNQYRADDYKESVELFGLPAVLREGVGL